MRNDCGGPVYKTKCENEEIRWLRRALRHIKQTRVNNPFLDFKEAQEIRALARKSLFAPMDILFVKEQLLSRNLPLYVRRWGIWRLNIWFSKA